MTTKARTYRLTALGAYERVITSKRTYVAQCHGKLAAMAVPTAEMARLWAECGGNLETVLGPIRESLKGAGYTDVFILPAQTHLVTLEEVDTPVVPTEENELRHRTTQLAALVRAVNELLVCLPPNPSPQLQRATSTLVSVLAQIGVEAWVR